MPYIIWFPLLVIQPPLLLFCACVLYAPQLCPSSFQLNWLNMKDYCAYMCHKLDKAWLLYCGIVMIVVGPVPVYWVKMGNMSSDYVAATCTAELSVSSNIVIVKSASSRSPLTARLGSATGNCLDTLFNTPGPACMSTLARARTPTSLHTTARSRP